MTSPRTRAERVWDIAALVLVLLGLALYLWVHFALDQIGDDVVVLSGAPGSSVATVDRLRNTGTVAIGIIVTGVVVGLWSYFRHGRQRTIPSQ